MSRSTKEIHRAIRKMFGGVAVTGCPCNHVQVPEAKIRYLFPAKATGWCPVHEQIRVRGQYLADLGVKVISEYDFYKNQTVVNKNWSFFSNKVR